MARGVVLWRVAPSGIITLLPLGSNPHCGVVRTCRIGVDKFDPISHHAFFAHSSAYCLSSPNSEVSCRSAPIYPYLETARHADDHCAVMQDIPSRFFFPHELLNVSSGLCSGSYCTFINCAGSRLMGKDDLRVSTQEDLDKLRTCCQYMPLCVHVYM